MILIIFLQLILPLMALFLKTETHIRTHICIYLCEFNAYPHSWMFLCMCACAMYTDKFIFWIKDYLLIGQCEGI